MLYSLNVPVELCLPERLSSFTFNIGPIKAYINQQAIIKLAQVATIADPLLPIVVRFEGAIGQGLNKDGEAIEGGYREGLIVGLQG